MNRDSDIGALRVLGGDPVDWDCILAHWDDLVRIAASIRLGTARASLILRKLAAQPRSRGLAKALREVARLERALFALDWLRDPQLRRRVAEGLNQGEAQNALKRAVFMHRLGELRDRTLEQQRRRASGLNLLVACIVLWNTMKLAEVLSSMDIDDEVVRHLSPIGWEHINLSGDYCWPRLCAQ